MTSLFLFVEVFCELGYQTSGPLLIQLKYYLKQLKIILTKLVRIITFSDPKPHDESLLKFLYLLKL